MKLHTRSRWLFLAALVLGSWIYHLSLAVPQLRSDHLQTAETPFFSDLYPRWRGTREWLWYGRDPYSPAVTIMIHEGLTGVPVPAGAPVPATDAFAYPLYFGVLLAPLTLIPYATLMPGLYLAGLGLLGLAVSLWIVAAGSWERLPGWLLVLGCSTPAAINAVSVQQPTLFSVACLAGALAALRIGTLSPLHVRRWYIAMGALLALATIKPQNCLLLLLVLGVWGLGNLRRYGAVFLGFAGTLGSLLVATELGAPGWILRWGRALELYQQAVPMTPLGLVGLPPLAATGLRIGLALGLVLLAWRLRRCPPGSMAFAGLCALALALSYLIFPSWTYQYLLLYPAILLVIGNRRALVLCRPLGRSLYVVITSFALWPFVVALPGAVLLGLGAVFAQPTLTSQAAGLWPLMWLPLLVLPFVLLPAVSLLIRSGLLPQKP